MAVRYKLVDYRRNMDYHPIFEDRLKYYRDVLDEKYKAQFNHAIDKERVENELIWSFSFKMLNAIAEVISNSGKENVESFFNNYIIRGHSINKVLHKLNEDGIERIEESKLCKNQKGKILKNKYYRKQLTSVRISEFAKIYAYYCVIKAKFPPEKHVLVTPFLAGCIAMGLDTTEIKKFIDSINSAGETTSSNNQKDFDFSDPGITEPSDQSKGDNVPVGSQWQRALATRYILNELNATNTDYSAYARFAQFFGGGNIDNLRKKIVPSKEEELPNSKRIEERKVILRLFKETGLKTLSDKVKSDIDKLK